MAASAALQGDAAPTGQAACLFWPGSDGHRPNDRCAFFDAGAVYGMTVVPCASTLCVVNIRQTEARVEAVLSEFVQLGQEAGQSNDQVTVFHGNHSVCQCLKAALKSICAG